MKPLLCFDNVTCRRGGRTLFEGLDLLVGPADALQVSGPNGSGKSSLLRLAAGLLRPFSGKVEAGHAALAGDQLGLDEELRLYDALRFWGGDVDAALADLGLGDVAHLPVRLLSAGQRKRAALARVFASAAPLWLLDEPANALDSASVGLMAKSIARHLESGGAVVAASHMALPGEWRELELRP